MLFNSFAFSRFTCTAFTLLALLLAIGSAQALDEKHYTTINTPYQTSSGSKIEVNEFFLFTCPHCYNLEPEVKKWQAESLPSNARFVKVPAIFGSTAEKHAKAYYTMQELDAPAQVFDGFFKKIQLEHRRMTSLNEIVEYLSELGYSEKDIRNTYNSFVVDSKVRIAKNLTVKSTIRSVPTFIVDGKYMTSASQTGSFKALFNTLNELIKKSANSQ